MGFGRKRGGLVSRLAVQREELAEAGGQFVLRAGPDLLERGGEGARDRPVRPGLELLVPRLKVVIIDSLGQSEEKLNPGEGAVNQGLVRTFTVDYPLAAVPGK